MLSMKMKRCLSFLMAMLMIVSLMPVSVLAADENTHDHSHEVVEQAATETPDVTPNLLIAEYQERIDQILIKYLGATEMGDEEIMAIVQGMGEDIQYSAVEELMVLDEECKIDLNSEDREILFHDEFVLNAFCEALASEIEIPTVYAGTAGTYYAPTSDSKQAIKIDCTTSKTRDGYISGDGTNTHKYQVQSAFWNGGTTTLKIYNNLSVKATLSFDYNCTTASLSSMTVDGASSTSGSFSKSMDAGANVTIVMKGSSGIGDSDPLLTLSNLNLVVDKEASTVTVNYNSAYGNVTVGGNATASGSVVENVTESEGIVLAATATNDNTFLGWVDGDGKILATTASYTLKPTNDMSVKAVFGSSTLPCFYVGGAVGQQETFGLLNWTPLDYYTVPNFVYLFDDLNAAGAAAKNSSSKVVVLANSATLASGTYTIPSGVTLLIPFDAANTMYTTQAQACAGDQYVPPSVYRKLTLADGANLIINGAMSVSAMTRDVDTSNMGGNPSGPCAFVDLAGNNSKITVNGSLYVYGYITGSGAVTANSGAKVYECFQIYDFRGGTATTDGDLDTNDIFPLNQYYVQNIEAPLTLNAGAEEYAFTTVFMSSTEFPASAEFVGDNGMFNMTSGSLTKRYDGATDRLILELNGSGSLNGISLTLGTSSVNSKDYDLPITNNITLKLDNGTMNVGQDMVMLPGAEMTIGENATVTTSKDVKLVVYDADQWGTFCSSSNKKLIPISYAPSKAYTRTEADLVDAKVVVNGTADLSAGYVYTTESGANICSTGGGKIITKLGTETVTYQATQGGSDGKDAIPQAINITPAKLTHGNGTTMTSGTNTYTYTGTGTEGRWVCAEHTYGEDTICDVCGYENACEHPTDKLETIAGYAATCSATGLTDGTKCTACDIITVAQTEIAKDPTNHVGETEAIPAVEATCKVEGFTAGVKCLGCGNVKSGHVSLGTDATKHPADKIIDVSGSAATCMKTGLTDGKKCTACDVFTVPQTVIPVDENAHSMKESAAKVEATCTAEGKEAVMTCENGCGHSTGGTVIPKLAHNMSDVAAYKAATCTAEGNEAYWYCSVCKVYYKDANGAEAYGQTKPVIDVDKSNHVGETRTETVDPTCTEDGSTKVICACGEVISETSIPNLGHSYGDWVITKNATCTEEGSKKQTCACGDENVETIPALQHTYTNYIYNNDAKCEVDGTKTAKCDNGCGTTDTVTAEDTALQHDYVGVYTAPDFGKDGYTTYTCKNDASHTYTEVDEGSALVAVAQIGEQKYASLDLAIAAAESGDTIVLLADHSGAENFAPIVLPAGVTLDLSGKTFTGAVAGRVMMNGGTLKTYADNNTTVYTMAGPEGSDAKYITSDMVFAMDTNWSMTIESGSAKLGDSWRTLPGQTVIIGEDANVTVPEGLTFTVLGNVTINGKLTCDGSIVLGAENATLTMAKDDSLNITTDVGDVVWYDGIKYVVHSHTPEADDGDCTTAIECSVCGTVTTPAKDAHTGGTATCTAQAVCSECGQSYGSTNDNHSYGEWTVIEAATCTEKGSQQRVCAYNANHVEDQEIPMLKHTHTQRDAIPATCNAAGNEAGIFCTECNKYISGGAKIEQLSHDYSGDIKNDGTTHSFKCVNGCDEYGGAVAHSYDQKVVSDDYKKSDATCTDYATYYMSCECGAASATDTFTAGVLLEHVYDQENVKEKALKTAANCTENAVYYKSCYCGEVSKTDTFELADSALGHDYEDKMVWTKDGQYTLTVTCSRGDYEETTTGTGDVALKYEPDCDTDGSVQYTATVTIGNNSETRYSEVFILDKNGHTPGEAVREKEVPATCYAEGSYDEVIKCSVEGCGEELSRVTKTIDKIAHTPGEATRDNEVAATCYAEGSYDEVVKCSVEKCGEELSRESKIIDKIAHTPGEATRDNEVAATCYAEGSYDEVVYCSVEKCGEELSRETKTIDKIAHTPGEATRDNEVAATCYAEGSYDEVVYCSVEECKHEISRTPKTIEKSAHTPADAVRENVNAATCYAEGSYDEVVYCSVEECKAELSREHKTIDKTEHTPAEAVRENVVDASCYAEGSYDEVVYCSVEKCKHEISRTKKTIEKSAHTPGEWQYDDANHWKKCTVEGCGAELDKAEHSYTEGKCVCGKEKPVAGTITLKQATLELESIVYLNIYSAITGFDGVDLENNMGLMVWTGEDTYNADLFLYDNENVSKYEGASKNNSWYKVQTPGIDAKKLGDEQYMRVYVRNPDGTYEYSKIIDYSAQKYALTMLANNSTDENLKRTLVAMLDYAAAAQIYFKYRTDDLANNIPQEYLDNYRTEFSEDMLKAVVQADSEVLDGWVRDRDNCPRMIASLILEGIITNNYNFKFTDSIMKDVVSAKVLFWDEETYYALKSSGKTFTMDNASDEYEMKLGDDGFYKGGYNKTAAQHMGKTLYTCGVVTTSDGNTYSSGVVAYSAHGYISSKLNDSEPNLPELLKCLATYGDCASVYFTNRVQ